MKPSFPDSPAPRPVTQYSRQSDPSNAHDNSGPVRRLVKLHFFATLQQLMAVLLTSFQDTLSGRRHSNDFAHARASYFRNRVLVIGVVFLVLTPFWTIFDFLVLPSSTLGVVLPARLGLVLALAAAIWLAYRAGLQMARVLAATSLLLGAPAVFYAVVVLSLGPDARLGLAGYDFIPYMLTVMMAIFPFALFEGLALGLLFFLIQVYALWAQGVLFSVAGWQALWLLAAILFITLTASYFHLALLMRLYREATHDGLTGLLNRTAFIASLEQLIEANRSHSIAILMLDLDYFKRLNDSYGHAAGDQVLQEFASIMRTSVRSGDFVARYGGEEFVIVLIDVSKDTALQIAEKIRTKTEQAVLHDHEDREIRFTVSIGVATLGSDESLSQAMRRADERLYEAKQISRNRVVGV